MPASLTAVQLCFVVDDVNTAVQRSERLFGWGPFLQFTAPNPEARYRDWAGESVTTVALGAAGATQIELIRVLEGQSPVAAYQDRYGTGLQHIGVVCTSIEEALETLAPLGAVCDDVGEYPGIRFAFVDIPTGAAMIELLEPDGGAGPPSPPESSTAASTLTVDSVFIVTADIDRTLRFFAGAFGWQSEDVGEEQLEIDGAGAGRLLRAGGRSGTLDFELVSPVSGDNPYSRHLARGPHGLVHGGATVASLDDTLESLVGNGVGVTAHGHWKGCGARFALIDGPAGPASLQLREDLVG